jgi:hypothetical protein
MAAIMSFGVDVIILSYYTSIYKWVRVVLYTIFVFLILDIEKEYKHHIFGQFFIADLCVCVFDAIVVTILMFMPDLAIAVRHYTEIVVALATIFTSFFAGTFLYQKVHAPAFKTIRTAYRLWAIRYFIYVIVLGGELIAHNHYNMGYLEMGTHTWWVITSWILRMPLLVFSRCILLYGVLQIKSAKELHEEHKASGKSHHNHHHSQTTLPSIDTKMIEDSSSFNKEANASASYKLDLI